MGMIFPRNLRFLHCAFWEMPRFSEAHEWIWHDVEYNINAWNDGTSAFREIGESYWKINLENDKKCFICWEHCYSIGVTVATFVIVVNFIIIINNIIIILICHLHLHNLMWFCNNIQSQHPNTSGSVSGRARSLSWWEAHACEYHCRWASRDWKDVPPCSKLEKWNEHPRT